MCNMLICCYCLAGLWFWPLKVQQHNWMWEAQQWPEQIPRLHVSTLLMSELWAVCATKMLDVICKPTLGFCKSFHFHFAENECYHILSHMKLPHGIMWKYHKLTSQEFPVCKYDSLSKSGSGFAFLGCYFSPYFDGSHVKMGLNMTIVNWTAENL